MTDSPPTPGSGHPFDEWWTRRYPNIPTRKAEWDSDFTRLYHEARSAWDAAASRGPQPTNPTLPRLVPDGPRRRMLIEIEVSANFETRLDNQWEVERELQADRWGWRWADESVAALDLAEHIQAMVEGLNGSSIGKEILRKAGL